jgi:hypothetical protein
METIVGLMTLALVLVTWGLFVVAERLQSPS